MFLKYLQSTHTFLGFNQHWNRILGSPLWVGFLFNTGKMHLIFNGCSLALSPPSHTHTHSQSHAWSFTSINLNCQVSHPKRFAQTFSVTWVNFRASESFRTSQARVRSLLSLPGGQQGWAWGWPLLWTLADGRRRVFGRGQSWGTLWERKQSRDAGRAAFSGEDDCGGGGEGGQTGW